VEPTDQIRLSDAEPWRPVSAVVGTPRRGGWKDHHYWYVLAALVVVMYLLRVGVFPILLVSGAYASWRYRKGKKTVRGGFIRWW
jgi:hypothetical protein